MNFEQQIPWQELISYLQETVISPCTTHQEKLYLFVSDEVAGLPVDQMYPGIAHHLDSCSACLGEYEILANLLTAALYIG